MNHLFYHNFYLTIYFRFQDFFSQIDRIIYQFTDKVKLI